MYYVCAHSFRVEQCIVYIYIYIYIVHYLHDMFIMYVCNEVHACMCECAFTRVY